MSEDHYGTGEKMVQFADLDKRHADLRLRLHYDGLTQGEFFRALVGGYVDRDSDIVNFIEKVKNDSEKYKPTLMKKRRRAYTKSKQVEKLFGLNEDEIENIFDMIQKEHKDL
jgi:hypothetical protein